MRFQIMDCKFQIADCGLQIADCGLRTGLPVLGVLPARRRPARVGTTCAVAILLAAVASAQDPHVAIDGRELATGRLRYSIGDNGLPSQIVILPAPADLPLEFRGEAAAAPGDAVLHAIGRGVQLAAPMSLVALVEGKDETLQPKAPAVIERTDGGAVCTAELAGGGVSATVRATYTPGGAVHVELAYKGGAVGGLSLVMPLAGPVDTVVQGVAPFDPAASELSDRPGLLWGNAAPADPAAKERRPESRGRAEVPRLLFWGSGDRGFSLVCDSADGWVHAPAVPCVTLTREDSGVVTWRALLVNHAAQLAPERRVRLTLLTHPAVMPAPGRRVTNWLDWPHDNAAAAAPEIATAPPAGGGTGLLRADCATAFEARASAILLAGPAGGDALSAAATLADAFPPPLFRYLAGTHTGLPAQLLANTPALMRAGMNPGAERMAVARALLHDIGFDARGAVHRAGLARAVSALAEFGCFEDDGMTEFLPYWRSRSAIRYGETFSADDVFAATAADPMARVYVSVWIRPHGKARKALILVANEGGAPVREQLYVLDAARLFGGANTVLRPDLVDRWDFGGIPEDSDWNKARVRGEVIAAYGPDTKHRSSREVPFLGDAEDGGGVAQSVRQEKAEVYLRTYVPARGFRLLYGSGKAE